MSIKYFRAIVDDVPGWAADELILKEGPMLIGKTCIARQGDWVVQFDTGAIRVIKAGSDMAELLNPWQTSPPPQNVPLDVYHASHGIVSDVRNVMGFWQGVDFKPTHWRYYRGEPSCIA